LAGAIIGYRVVYQRPTEMWVVFINEIEVLMPWVKSDVDSHIKGLSDKEKEQWVSTANSAREKCIADGGDEKECDGRAIQKANAAVSKKESMILASSGSVLLEEANDKDSNVFPIKIIQPGWGSSGYYGSEMLKRDGPNVFKAGTHCYWDHPSMSQETDRPERSLRDLAGVLASDAEWKEKGIHGSGLYSYVKAFEPYVSAVRELAPHIGVSIRASGVAADGEADGENGLIIEEITDAASVDFVTMPGAGGKVIEMFES